MREEPLQQDQDRAADPGERTRKFTKELLDISKNAVFVGGVRYLANKGESSMLLWFSWFLYAALLMHIQSYIQGKNVGRFLHERVGLWPKVASVVGWSLALFLSFLVVMAIDQGTDQIARAQAR